MSALPFADHSFDWVFCCEVLHHNNRQGMTDALYEIHRVLRPGGSPPVINEPLRRPTNLKRDHAAEVARFAGNEHVYYFFPEYLWMAWRAGFHHIRITEPASDTFHSHNPIHLTLKASTRRANSSSQQSTSLSSGHSCVACTCGDATSWDHTYRCR